MQSYGSMMAFAVALSAATIAPIFVLPITETNAVLAALLAGLMTGFYGVGLTLWCWRIYMAASAAMDIADPAQGRRPVFLVAAIGMVVVAAGSMVPGLPETTGSITVMLDGLAVVTVLALFYSIWLTAKALAGLPANRFGLGSNAAFLSFLQIFYLPLGLFFLRRRLKTLFPV